MGFLSLIEVNINVHSNNGSIGNHPQQGPDRPPTADKSNHTSLIDWIMGTVLACFADPYLGTVRAWMVDLLLKFGEKPELAPATAVLISSAVLCAAPALLRWVVSKY